MPPTRPPTVFSADWFSEWGNDQVAWLQFGALLERLRILLTNGYFRDVPEAGQEFVAVVVETYEELLALDPEGDLDEQIDLDSAFSGLDILKEFFAEPTEYLELEVFDTEMMPTVVAENDRIVAEIEAEDPGAFEANSDVLRPPTA